MLRFCLVFVLAFPAVGFAADVLDGPVDVIDADTWDVGGIRVRLHGIDAPELDQTCRDENGAVWPCGAWATSVVQERFQGKTARCTPLDRDRYGRVVARCQIGGVDAGRHLVLDGLAFAYRKYSDDYVAAENAAMSRSAGLHASQVRLPWVHRASGQTVSQPCRIKGNISPKGEKIYHVRGQRYYSKTKIDARKGERWFCSGAQARAAGWRAAKR